MRKLLCSAVSFAFIAWLVSPAQAGMVDTYVVADGVEDELTDTSRALLDDLDSSGSVTVGDVIYGWVAISGVNPDPNGYGLQPNRIVIVFSAKIVSQSGTRYTLDYNDTDSHDLLDLLPPALHPKNGRTGTLGQDEIAVVISGPNPVSPVIDPNVFAAGNAFNVGYQYEATLGLVGPEDFFEADLGVGANNERGGFTVMDASGSYGNSPSVIYIPVTVTDLGGVTHSVEVSLEGTIFAPGANGYDFSDLSNFRINAAPEPATFALWGLIGAAGATYLRRRRVS